MKVKNENTYRKNYTLITIFLILISFVLMIGLYLGFKYTQEFIESRFVSYKSQVLDEVLEPYNELNYGRIPQISLYQGFMDSSSFSAFSKSLLTVYPFIDSIYFYEVETSNHVIKDGFGFENFSIGVKDIYSIDRKNREVITIFKRGSIGKFSIDKANDFSTVIFKYVKLVSDQDTSKQYSDDLLFRTYYTFSYNTVSYLNIPRSVDMNTFRDLMFTKQPPSEIYPQDLLTFFVNPGNLEIKNPRPLLYEKILIRRINFDSLETDKNHFTTGVALPGPFSESQLYFISSRKFLNRQVGISFTPIAISILIVYCLIVFISYLIFRNLNVNSKMFKLQYDFINNLTHEFKTPVSVIKIAGNNIKNAVELSDREKNMYGKILDEEADKLNNLMNKLLSLTQVENQSIEVKKEDIFLESFLNDMIQSYKLKFPDFDIQYKLNNISEIISDEVLLSSIFQNLIDNAYKYSYPDRKKLFITIGRNKKFVIMGFKDQGIGIAKNEQENIFKKFYRIENEFNRQGSVGIGLAFCKEIINFMNGEIAIESEPGIGSEFLIQLPLL